MDEALPIQRPLVAEGVVKAGAGNTHPSGEVAHRRLLEALRPEAVHRRLQHGRLVELSRSRHRPPRASGTAVPLSSYSVDKVLEHACQNGQALVSIRLPVHKKIPERI